MGCGFIPMAATIQRLGHSRVNPSVYLSPTAQPISNSPATNRMVHAMSCLPISRRQFLPLPSPCNTLYYTQIEGAAMATQSQKLPANPERFTLLFCTSRREFGDY